MMQVRAQDLQPGMVIQSDDGPVTVIRVQRGFVRYETGPSTLITFTGGWCHKPSDALITVETD
jgi:hypothetical protein